MCNSRMRIGIRIHTNNFTTFFCEKFVQFWNRNKNIERWNFSQFSFWICGVLVSANANRYIPKTRSQSNRCCFFHHFCQHTIYERKQQSRQTKNKPKIMKIECERANEKRKSGWNIEENISQSQQPRTKHKSWNITPEKRRE